jgi:hypothetical protein
MDITMNQNLANMQDPNNKSKNLITRKVLNLIKELEVSATNLVKISITRRDIRIINFDYFKN